MRPSSSRSLPALATILVALVVVVGAAQIEYAGAPTLFASFALLVAVAAAGYLIWNVEPVYTLCGAIVLSVFSGHWEEFGLPGFASPDRVLLLAALGAVLVRAPGARDRPPLRIDPIHWLMIATAGYAVVSAAVAGTLSDRGAQFDLLEAFGLLPFLVFLVAPVVFRTERNRDLLLKTLVGLGAYLGLMTLFQTIYLGPLVWPKYILDPAVGVNFSHSRGPFAEPVTNGFALYVCAVACAIAWSRWRDRPLPARTSAAVGLLCLAGTFMTLQRSVWLGVVIATVIALLAVSEARRYAPVVLGAMALMFGASMLLIPGFADRVSLRSNNEVTIWDRKNLTNAATNMIEARPLLGFGWSQFREKSVDYFEQSPDYPLTNVAGVALHSSPLTYAVELGLLGATLWIATLVFGVGAALGSRGPPDLFAWRVGLMAVATCFVVIMNFVPPSYFPTLALWLFAGLAWSGRYAPRRGRSPGPAQAGSGDHSRPPRMPHAASP
jgi:putative inorganic carbon (HCO3(-)) transporter